MAVAPTYTLPLPNGAPNAVPGNLKQGVLAGTVGAADTYVTNGFSVPASLFGLTNVVSAEPVLFSTGHWGRYIPATGLLQVFSAAATELVNASAALQNATFTLRVWGY